MFFKIWRGLDAAKKRFAIILAATLFAAYAIFIFFSATTLLGNKESAAAGHVIRMSETAVEPGQTPPEPLPATGNFTTVKIGSYVENIYDLSINNSSWTANFYVWYSWTGPKNLNPGGNMLLVDGTILKKEMVEEYDGEGDVHYQKYRVSAKLLKFFDTSRVPLESHMLNIYIEDGARDGSKLRLVADKTSNISSRTRIPGYKILGASNVVKPHTYRTSYGDPRLAANDRKTYTQYIIGVNIKRSTAGVYGKIFLALFAALTLTLASFFVKASDVGPRLGLPSAAFFGAVSNAYVANSILPPSGSFGLVDHIGGFGLATIFFAIALSLLSNYVFVKKDDKDFSYILDRLMFAVIATGCLAANIIIPWSAAG